MMRTLLPKTRLRRLTPPVTHWRPRRMRELARDTNAAIAPMVAVLGMSLVLAAGLALDVTLYIAGNRDLRSATEAAALAAAQNPADAQNRATTYLTRQGYNASVLQSVEVGRYCASSHIAADQRFDPTFSRCPGSGMANAVRVTATMPSRRFLTGVLGARNPIPDLAATATAARIDEAGIGITTDILTEVLSGLRPVSDSLVKTVNDLLGALLGIPLSLGKTDVQALMQGNVDAGLFFDNLAKAEGFSGTYGELMARSHGMQDIANAAADAAANPATAASLRVFAGLVNNSYQVPFTGLFGLGVWKDMPVGEADAKPALRAGMNAYQLLTFAAQAGPGVVDASDLVSIAVPGSTVSLAAMARGPLDRPRFSFGAAGETEVGTSALRLQLNLGLGNIGRLTLLGIPLPLSVDSLPLLIDVAGATATIPVTNAGVSGIDCSSTANQAQNTRVAASVNTGLVRAYIGHAPADALTRSMPASASEITPVRLINVLNLITIDAKAIAQPVMGNQRTVIFGPGGDGTIGSPTTTGKAATVGNGSQVGPLISSLTGSLSGPGGLTIGLGSLCYVPLLGNICSGVLAPVTGPLLSGIGGTLGGLAGTVVDPLLDNVLAALGVQLGSATVWATGARCGVPVLV